MNRLRTLDAALVAALVAVSGSVVLAFIANSTQPDRFPDSPAYEAIANHLPGSFISSERLPGYPVVIAIASTLPGGLRVNLLILQSLMTIASVVLTYFIGRAALGKRWIAFLCALLVATDLLMAGFARVEMTEATAVFLTNAMAAAVVAYIRRPEARWLVLATVLLIALLFTRAEWALFALVLVPYVLIVLARRGLFTRTLLAQGAAAVGAVLVCIGGYSVANQAVNGYFGMSSVLNVALMGKVMVYRMELEAPPPYDQYAPLVAQVGPAQGPWPLTQFAPFNDRNHLTEGQFARAVITHHPVEFAQHVLGTLVDSTTAYDTAFIRINHDDLDPGPLVNLLHLSELRYAAFVLLLPIALVWAVLGLIARPENVQAQIMGALGVFVLYGSVTAAATTFDEFGRVHMPINPVGTVLVAGTLLLNVRALAARPVGFALLALAALITEVAAVLVLPGRTASVMLPSLLVIFFLQLLATSAGFTARLEQHRVVAADGEGVGGHVDEGQRERRPEPGHAAAPEPAKRSD